MRVFKLSSRLTRGLFFCLIGPLGAHATSCENPVAGDRWQWLLGKEVTPFSDPFAGTSRAERESLIKNPRQTVSWLFGENPHFHFQSAGAHAEWSAGSAQGEFILANYLKTPDIRFRELDYLLFIRSLFNGALGRIDKVDRPMWLEGKQVAFALHSEHGGKTDGAYWAIHGARFEEFKNELPENLRNLPEQYFSLIEKTYEKRMQMDRRTARRLTDISRQLMSRSMLILKTKNSFLHFGDPKSAESARPGPFIVEGGLLITWSRDPSEKLPVEIFNGKSVKRNSRNAGEVSRFVVDRGAVRDLSAREMQAAATAMVGLGIAEVKCEADLPRSEIFLRQGMIVEEESPTSWSGKPDRILSGDPEILTNIAVDHPMNAPLYRFDRQQTLLLHRLQAELGERLW